MARPKDENYDGKKEAILKAAARAFADKGFLKTNIIDIGEASGASKSRMYHYFTSKEALLAELLLTHVAELLEAVSEAVRASKPGPARLQAMVDAHVDQYMEAFAEHKLLLSESNNLPPEQRAQLVELEDQLIRLMTGVLREVAPDKLKSAPVARVHAMLVYGMLNWTFTWYKPGGPVTPRQLADHVYGMAIGGLSERVPSLPVEPAAAKRATTSRGRRAPTRSTA